MDGNHVEASLCFPQIIRLNAIKMLYLDKDRDR
jgi:hypothetical protein